MESDSRIHNVRMCNGRLLGDVIHTELVCRIEEQLHNNLGPVCPIPK